MQTVAAHGLNLEGLECRVWGSRHIVFIWDPDCLFHNRSPTDSIRNGGLTAQVITWGKPVVLCTGVSRECGNIEVAYSGCIVRMEGNMKTPIQDLGFGVSKEGSNIVI